LYLFLVFSEVYAPGAALCKRRWSDTNAC